MAVFHFITRAFERISYLRTKFDTINNQGDSNSLYCVLASAMKLEETSTEKLKSLAVTT